MCLAVPMKLTKIEGNSGVVELEGVKKNVNLSFIEMKKKHWKISD